jgi:hypothetical protein
VLRMQITGGIMGGWDSRASRPGGRSRDGSPGSTRRDPQGHSQGDSLSDVQSDLRPSLKGSLDDDSERLRRRYPDCDYRRYLPRHSQGDLRCNSQDDLQTNLHDDLRCLLQGELRGHGVRYWPSSI